MGRGDSCCCCSCDRSGHRAWSALLLLPCTFYLLCLGVSLLFAEFQPSNADSTAHHLCTGDGGAGGIATDCDVTSALQVGVEVNNTRGEMGARVRNTVAAPGGGGETASSRAAAAAVASTEGADRDHRAKVKPWQRHDGGEPLAATSSDQPRGDLLVAGGGWLSLLSSPVSDAAEERIKGSQVSASSVMTALLLTVVLIFVFMYVIFMQEEISPGTQVLGNGTGATTTPAMTARGTASALPSQQQLVAHGSLPSARPSILATQRTSLGMAQVPASQPMWAIPRTAGALQPVTASRTSVPLPPKSTGVLQPIIPHTGSTRQLPKPHHLSHMALSKAGLERQVRICDPSLWPQAHPYFTIRAKELQILADGEGSSGTFDVFRGIGIVEPVFRVSVMPWGSSPRALLIFAVERAGEMMGYSAPTSVDNDVEFEIFDQNSRSWGMLIAQGGDMYAVRQDGGRQVFSLFGNQETGQLQVKLGEEVVAISAHNDAVNQVEVGIKPEVDPVLMLISMLSVLIFNPEDLDSPP